METMQRLAIQAQQQIAVGQRLQQGAAQLGNWVQMNTPSNLPMGQQ
jgi:hypothetical protein